MFLKSSLIICFNILLAFNFSICTPPSCQSKGSQERVKLLNDHKELVVELNKLRGETLQHQEKLESVNGLRRTLNKMDTLEKSIENIKQVEVLLKSQYEIFSSGGQNAKSEIVKWEVKLKDIKNQFSKVKETKIEVENIKHSVILDTNFMNNLVVFYKRIFSSFLSRFDNDIKDFVGDAVDEKSHISCFINKLFYVIYKFYILGDGYTNDIYYCHPQVRCRLALFETLYAAKIIFNKNEKVNQRIKEYEDFLTLQTSSRTLTDSDLTFMGMILEGHDKKNDINFNSMLIFCISHVFIKLFSDMNESISSDSSTCVIMWLNIVFLRIFKVAFYILEMRGNVLTDEKEKACLHELMAFYITFRIYICSISQEDMGCKFIGGDNYQIPKIKTGILNNKKCNVIGMINRNICDSEDIVRHVNDSQLKRLGLLNNVLVPIFIFDSDHRLKSTKYARLLIAKILSISKMCVETYGSSDEEILVPKTGNLWSYLCNKFK